MNILIIGGSLGLAVLAILGAVLLGIGEDRADKARKELQAQQNSAPTLLAQQSQSRQSASQESAQQSIPATPVLSRQTITLPVPSEGLATSDLNLADLNGQVREITGELRALAQRAGELQQRLNMLSELLERRESPAPDLPHASVPVNLFTSDTETQIF